MVIDLTLGVLWVAERRITGRFLIHCWYLLSIHITFSEW
jgi:hypothetical protein